MFSELTLKFRHKYLPLLKFVLEHKLENSITRWLFKIMANNTYFNYAGNTTLIYYNLMAKEAGALNSWTLLSA